METGVIGIDLVLKASAICGRYFQFGALSIKCFRFVLDYERREC